MSVTKAVGRLTLWALVVYLFIKGALVLVPRKFVLAISALVAALVHVCSGPATPTSSDGGGSLEERGQGNLVGVSEGNERPEGCVSLTALDHAQVLGVDAGLLRGFLLGQPLLLSNRPKTQPEPLLGLDDGSLDGRPAPDLGRSVRAIGR